MGTGPGPTDARRAVPGCVGCGGCIGGTPAAEPPSERTLAAAATAACSLLDRPVMDLD